MNQRKVTIQPTLRGAPLRLDCVGDQFLLPGDHLRVDDKFTPEERAKCERLRDDARVKLAKRLAS